MAYCLFDLGQDPGEQIDIAEEHPERIQQMLRMRDEIRRQMVGFEERVRGAGFEPVAEPVEARLDAKAVYELEALGYVGEDER